MKRKIQAELLIWKDQAPHIPLIIRGARQVGKSHLIESFGQAYFESVLTINFERSPHFKTCFDHLDPVKILNQLELLSGQAIHAGKTLLFLDEIQECPAAIQSLRYFKEEYPDLHVIGAGSLLEFALTEADFSMPVGRVQFLYLKPLSFEEFLWALGDEKLVDYLMDFSFSSPFPSAIHQVLLEKVRLYLLLGGMPAVIQIYLDTRSIERAVQIQLALLQTYRADFSKYGRRQEYAHLETLFAKIPHHATQQLKYSKINPDVDSRTLKGALEKLVLAGLMIPVYQSSASGLPLSATINPRKFKMLFMDVGLMLRAQGVISPLLLSEDILFLSQGAMMEQFVGQELLAYQYPYSAPELFFWSREAKSSQAEVDYLILHGTQILPIEVKSKSVGHLKSIKRFMEEKNAPLGIRISEHPFSFKDQILSVPLYAIFGLQNYLSQSAS